MLTQLVAMAKMKELEREIEARRRRHELGLDVSDTRRISGVGRALRLHQVQTAIRSAVARVTGQPTTSERSIARARLAAMTTRSTAASCCAAC